MLSSLSWREWTLTSKHGLLGINLSWENQCDSSSCLFFVFVLLRWFHLVCFVLIFIEMFFWIKTRLVFQHARWTCCLVSPCWGQVAFSFPPPSQLEPLLPDMEDDDEAEGKEGPGKCGNGDRWNGVVVYDMWKRTSAALRWTTLRSRRRVPQEAFLLDLSHDLIGWHYTSSYAYVRVSVYYDTTVLYILCTYVYVYIYIQRDRERRASRRSLVVWVVGWSSSDPPRWIVLVGTRILYWGWGTATLNNKQTHRFEY